MGRDAERPSTLNTPLFQSFEVHGLIQRHPSWRKTPSMLPTVPSTNQFSRLPELPVSCSLPRPTIPAHRPFLQSQADSSRITRHGASQPAVYELCLASAASNSWGDVIPLSSCRVIISGPVRAARCAGSHVVTNSRHFSTYLSLVDRIC